MDEDGIDVDWGPAKADSVSNAGIGCIGGTLASRAGGGDRASVPVTGVRYREDKEESGLVCWADSRKDGSSHASSPDSPSSELELLPSATVVCVAW